MTMKNNVAVIGLALTTVIGTANAANISAAGPAKLAGLVDGTHWILAQAWRGDPGRGGDGASVFGVPGGQGGASGAAGGAGGGNWGYGVTVPSLRIAPSFGAYYPAAAISKHDAVYIARQNGLQDVESVRTRRNTIKVSGYDYDDQPITVVVDRRNGAVVNVY